jgi:hypothetical protein
MKTIEFDGKTGIVVEKGDINKEIKHTKDIDVILVSKEFMVNFRSSKIFSSLWEHISDKTRIVYV